MMMNINLWWFCHLDFSELMYTWRICSFETEVEDAADNGLIAKSVCTLDALTTLFRTIVIATASTASMFNTVVHSIP